MVIKDAFVFSSFPQESDFRKIDNSKWEQIPHPTYSKNEYYISENACVVGIYEFKDHYLMKEIKVIVRKHTHNPIIRLPTGNSNRLKSLGLAKCMVLAFNKMSWEDSIEIVHLDGNIQNCKLSNLTVRAVDFVSNYDSLYSFAHLYDMYFNSFVHTTQFQFCFSYQDAKDIIQDAFLKTFINKKYENEHFAINAWRISIKQLSLSFTIRYLNKNILGHEFSQKGFEYDFPLQKFIENEKMKLAFELVSHGYSHDEASKKMSISKKYFGELVYKSYRQVKTKLKKEYELYR